MDWWKSKRLVRKMVSKYNKKLREGFETDKDRAKYIAVDGVIDTSKCKKNDTKRNSPIMTD